MLIRPHMGKPSDQFQYENAISGFRITGIFTRFVYITIHTMYMDNLRSKNLFIPHIARVCFKNVSTTSGCTVS